MLQQESQVFKAKFDLLVDALSEKLIVKSFSRKKTIFIFLNILIIWSILKILSINKFLFEIFSTF